MLHLEELLVLLHQGIFRLLQDLHHCFFIELAEGGKNREPADKLGDKTELEQILGGYDGEELARPLLDLLLHIRAKTESFHPDALLNDVVQAGKGAAADKQDIRGVNFEKLLLGM